MTKISFYKPSGDADESVLLYGANNSSEVTVTAPAIPPPPPPNDDSPDGSTPTGSGSGNSGNGWQGSGLYQTTRPGGFSSAVDTQADQMARNMAHNIAGKADSKRFEYSGVIWKDANGTLHSTDVFKGGAFSAPLDQAWAQIQWGPSVKVVAIIHSHPTERNDGTPENPSWVASDSAQFSVPSAFDFDQLLRDGNQRTGAFDFDNYRAYIAFGESVKEYHAWQQDPGMIGRDGQATWAVPSNDFGQSQ